MLPHARVEHIGASAILDAYSKGDLDIFVGVPARDLGAAIESLKELSFEIKQDTFRSEELCMLVLEGASSDVAAQVVAMGSKYDFFLQFRDLLRNNPQLVSD